MSRCEAALRAYLGASAVRAPVLWVVGDPMLDEYQNGASVTSSRAEESDVTGDVQLLGGAANAAAGVAALGGRVVLGGVIGKDLAGQQIQSLCRKHQINARAVLELADRMTTRKVRVIVDPTLTKRVDYETRAEIAPDDAGRIAALLSKTGSPEALVVSDYAKGVIVPHLARSLLHEARKRGVPVVVDSKAASLAQFRGASWLTPNLNELAAAHGCDLVDADLVEIELAARALAKRLELNGVLVTLSARGMLFVPATGVANHIPSDARYVSDSTGAGDSVTAAFALGLALKLEPGIAARFASVVAGHAVEKPMTAAVRRATLEAGAHGWLVDTATSSSIGAESPSGSRKQLTRSPTTS